MSTIIQKAFNDDTCHISLSLTSTPEAHSFLLHFESSKITKANRFLDFSANFTFPKNDTFTRENIYLAVVNYLLHDFYDSLALTDEEENTFCEINNCLDDNLESWEQGQVYINNKDTLFHRASIGYSATDTIRITEGKMKHVIELIFAEIK